MDTQVFLAILAAAAMHAGWNAILKIRLDRLLGITLVAGFAALVSLPLLPFVDVPAVAAWPWLAASVILHIGYNLFLTKAYDAGDLGQVYPIARGSAPLVTAIVGFLFVGEALSPPAVVGVCVLVAGVWFMSAYGGSGLPSLGGNAVVLALITSLFISAYSISDGLGARIGGTAHGYTLWLFVIDGVVMVLLAIAMRGQGGIIQAVRHWRSGLIAGCLSLGAYWIVIWAMTKVPIALAAALRESSVLFAAIISVTLLGEPLRLTRSLAAVLILAGILLLRLG